MCKFVTCHAPAAGKLHFLPVSFSFSHLKTRENEIVGGGLGCQIHSLQLCPFHLLPQKFLAGVRTVRSSYCLCKFTTCHAPAAGELHFLPLSFSFSHLKTRENDIVGGGIGCEIHSVQLCPFHFLFKIPANAGGKISHFLCKFTTCHAPAAGKLHFLPVSFSFSHLKTRENEIVGGGIGCQIHSLQLCPFHFLPQNSGKFKCRG